MAEDKKNTSKTSKKESDRYVAYISTYTQGDNHGIKIYDVNMETGRFSEKDEVEMEFEKDKDNDFDYYYLPLRKLNKSYLALLSEYCKR